MDRRGSISNVLYSNVSYTSNGLQWVRSRIVGNSTVHAVDGVQFKDFRINGSLVHSLEDLNTLDNAFVTNVSFA
jgi:hypothetical protein